MKLIELIIEALESSEVPLIQKEIFEIIENNPKHFKCEEYCRVKVPLSAVARCISKHSVGTNPVIGILSEAKDKASFKKFYLQNKNYDGQKIVSEINLHPYLVKFVFERFNVYSKTINALKGVNTKNKIGKWTNPDIVGINPVLLNLNELFQKEVEKLGILSTKVFEFYSFELKLKINKSNITECYFQAVSNSNWANFGYLVVEDLDRDKTFLSNLTRLNSAYGIGVIKLNLSDPINSEIIVSARQKDIADINFMNFLSSSNKDFYLFVEEAIKIIDTKKINYKNFDEITNLIL